MIPPTSQTCHSPHRVALFEFYNFFSAQAEAEFAAFSACPLPVKAPECSWKAQSDPRTRTTLCTWPTWHQEVELRWRTPGVLEIPISSSGAPSAADPIRLEWLVVAVPFSRHGWPGALTHCPLQWCFAPKLGYNATVTRAQTLTRRKHHGPCSWWLSLSFSCFSIKPPSRTLCSCVLPSLLHFQKSAALLI